MIEKSILEFDFKDYRYFNISQIQIRAIDLLSKENLWIEFSKSSKLFRHIHNNLGNTRKEIMLCSYRRFGTIMCNNLRELSEEDSETLKEAHPEFFI